MTARKQPRFKTGVPYDEATRAEHGEHIARPKPNNVGDDPTDPSDAGPHVERVGMPTPDEA
jgi:hypothetical protein